MLRLKPSPASEQSIAQLDQLYKDYERRILWRLNAIEEKLHLEQCANTPEGQWCKCRTKQQEVHEWEDWAMENFGKQMQEIDWTLPAKTLNRVSVPSGVDSYSRSSATSKTRLQATG